MFYGATADSHPPDIEGIMTNSIDVEYLGNGTPKVTNVQRIRQQGDSDDNGITSGAAGSLISFISMILIVITFPVSLIFCLKIVQEYERAVIFRLGRVNKTENSSVSMPSHRGFSIKGQAIRDNLDNKHI